MSFRTLAALSVAATIAAPAVAVAGGGYYYNDCCVRHHHHKHLKERVYVETSVYRAGLGSNSIIDANYENNKQPVFLIHRRRAVGGQIRFFSPARYAIHALCGGGNRTPAHRRRTPHHGADPNVNSAAIGEG